MSLMYLNNSVYNFTNNKAMVLYNGTSLFLKILENYNFSLEWFLIWMIFNLWILIKYKNWASIQNLELQRELNIYKNYDKAQRNYVFCKKQKKIAKLTKKLYKQQILIEKLKNQSRAIIKTDILHILNDDTNVYETDFWTLTRLKQRAKDLEITLLSKYNLDGRKALISAIRDRERLVLIKNVIENLN